MAWKLPGFKPVARLGSGATGVVVSARDLTSETMVAIKYLSPNVYREPGFKERFRTEAGILASIEHPNVAQVCGYEEANDAGAVVTHLIDGVTLRQFVSAGGALDPEAAFYVLKGVLQGVAEAHTRDIVHRDIKPENVIIDNAGMPKVVDFGIVARVAGVCFGDAL